MKTTKIYLVVCLTFLLTQFNALAQYNGGNSSGATANELSVTGCSIPAHFYAYFGGNNDGSSVEELSTTTCGTAPFQYAYLGGNADGAATEEISTTVCGIPPSFFAYMGGNNDGAHVETFEVSVCAFPPQFYAYFGGDGDGHTLDVTAPICPTQPPVASFTASSTSVCVGQSVTFTDTSTNIPSAWTWTFTGGTPNSSIVQNPVITYNTPGSYAVTLVAANFNGTDTETITSYITVYANPTVTSTSAANRCGTGTVTLGATASTGTLSWYANAIGGTASGTGTSFVTPSISVTTPYYVEAVNGVCTSARTIVNATVNTIPTIISTTPNSRCGTGSVVLAATSSVGGGIPFWYANPTGGTALATTNNFTTPSISISTTYYVEASNGTCTATSRVAVIATVNTLPTVLTTIPASRCDAGTVTLNATASSGTLNWYANPTGGTALGTGTSFTTPSLSGTTTYYVEASNGTCISSRTAVTATINATPIVTGTASSRCDAGTLVLAASASAGTISWYANASGGSALGTGTSFTTPSISITTSYYAEAVNGTCTSARTLVVATVNASPTITSTTPMSICSGDSFTIAATASAGTVNWYNLPTGGTVLATGSNYSLGSLSSTATYYAQAINGSCSSARSAVEVTVTNRPTNTSSTSASRCGNGSVMLTATFSSGTVNWYDAPTLGNLVGTGSNFTTPSLSITTNYYAEATNASCTSLSRTAVTATVNEQPVLLSTTPASRCGDGSVTLQATASIGTINWYNAPVGGTLVANGGSFTTPVLGVTTPYYVEVVNGTCASARTTVTATVDVVATITSTTPANRCDTGTLTLNATSNLGALNWYDAPTLGNLVGTGTSFTTPSISVSTNYYVEATNGSCTSPRVAVTAAINPTAAPTGFANQTFCAGETVELINVQGSNVIWYTAPSNGSVIPSGTPLVSGTIYYGSQLVGTCESPNRIAVTMTLGGCLGREEFEMNKLKVYPNPVVDILNISYTNAITKVEVVNLLGQLVDAKFNNATESQIDMSRLASGTYLIRITIDDTVKTVKVIKR